MRDDLLSRVNALLGRLPHLGIGPDIHLMTTAELWGLCCYLRRLADGA